RAATWIIALLWMGTAYILNSRWCGRTHCRYTGPYYLAMIGPMLVLASGVISGDFYAWLSIGGSHFLRKHDHFGGHGKGVGKILVEPWMQGAWARCQCHRHEQRPERSSARPIEQ